MVKGGLPHTLKGERKSAHVRNLARHKELQSVLGAWISAKIYETLVHNLSARFRGNIAAQVDI